MEVYDMATPEDVQRLRRLTGLDPDDTTYTGDLLSTYIDNLGSVEHAARALWGEIAAASATLVDVTESGSSRRLSQIADNALKMRGAFPGDDDDGLPGGGTFTVGMERV
jgi:hypothetical protein